MIHTTDADSGVRHGLFATSLGELLLVADGDAITGVYFQDHKHPPSPDEIGDDLGFEPDDRTLAEAAQQLRDYLAGERQTFTARLAPQGEDFSQRVWEALLRIPFGETTTYGNIAVELGNRAFAQRVGQAVGHNPIMVLIPCHRVLGADGTLTGYAGGLDRKRVLLTLEEPPAEETDRLF